MCYKECGENGGFIGGLPGEGQRGGNFWLNFKMREREWIRCDRCDGEIYEGSEYYQINGQCVCRECLEEFAGHWFAPFRLIAGEEL